MTIHDIYLLSPEISMAGLAMLLILVDLVVSRKSVLTIVAVLGLAVPLALSIVLWFDLTGQAATQMKADFGMCQNSRIFTESSSLWFCLHLPE